MFPSQSPRPTRRRVRSPTSTIAPMSLRHCCQSGDGISPLQSEFDQIEPKLSVTMIFLGDSPRRSCFCSAGAGGAFRLASAAARRVGRGRGHRRPGRAASFGGAAASALFCRRRTIAARRGRGAARGYRRSRGAAGEGGAKGAGSPRPPRELPSPRRRRNLRNQLICNSYFRIRVFVLSFYRLTILLVPIGTRSDPP